MISRRELSEGRGRNRSVDGRRPRPGGVGAGSGPPRLRVRPASRCCRSSTRSSAPAATATPSPGASMPSGMVQLSPDSGKQGWDWCAGYHYSDTEIAGFSHTHLSGTGIGDLCDILVTPTLAGARHAGGRRVAVLARQGEGVGRLLLGRPPGVRHPGRADGHAARRPATATRSSGRRRGRQPAVAFDLGFAINWDQPVETQITLEGPTTISGYRFSKGWAKDQRVYFVARFSTPILTWLLGDRTATTRPSAARSRRSGRAGCSGSCCGRASRCS